MDSESDVALETEQLGKKYGKNRAQNWALRNCSFRLPPGRIAALVGPNGAGKSTLLHLAVGLLEPDVGTVRIFGAAPFDGFETAHASILADIGFVAQDTPLYADFTAAELLTMGSKLNRRLGRHPGPNVVGATRYPTGSAGGQVVRRPASPGRARPRAGQTPAAVAAGRAGGQPRSTGPSGVPAGADRQCRGDRHHGAAVVPPGRRSAAAHRPA